MQHNEDVALQYNPNNRINSGANKLIYPIMILIIQEMMEMLMHIIQHIIQRIIINMECKVLNITAIYLWIHTQTY